MLRPSNKGREVAFWDIVAGETSSNSATAIIQNYRGIYESRIDRHGSVGKAKRQAMYVRGIRLGGTTART